MMTCNGVIGGELQPALHSEHDNIPPPRSSHGWRQPDLRGPRDPRNYWAHRGRKSAEAGSITFN